MFQNPGFLKIEGADHVGIWKEFKINGSISLENIKRISVDEKAVLEAEFLSIGKKSTDAKYDITVNNQGEI